MAMLPQQATSDSAYCVSGNVTIHPSAAIAPTAVLRADPGSHLILGPDVCVGRGAVLHAVGGVLAVEAGASLGSTVLLVGGGTVGANACIGSGTTVINPQVAAGAAIAPHSLLGDTSRKILSLPEDAMVAETDRSEPSLADNATAPAEADAAAEETVWGLDRGRGAAGDAVGHPSRTEPTGVTGAGAKAATSTDAAVGQEAAAADWNGGAAIASSSQATTTPPAAASGEVVGVSSESFPAADQQGAIASRNLLGGPVYGKEAVSRLMAALFPHRQTLHSNPAPEQPNPPT